MKHLKVTSVLLSVAMIVSMVTMPVSVFADETEASSETQATEKVEETEKKEEKETEKKPDVKAEEETTPAPSETEKQEEAEPSEPEETTKEEPAETDKQEPDSDEDEAQEPEETEEQEEKAPVAVDEPESVEETKDSMDAIDSGECGENVKWTYDGEGTLTITGSGAMNNYNNPFKVSDNRPWASYCTSIKNVVISKGVTTVGACAFFSCNHVTSVSLPDGLKTINAEAFACCNSLISFSIPKSVTTIGEYAFEYCEYLTNINIPSGVKMIQNNAFDHCVNLKSITIPASVAEIGESAFEYSGLENVIIQSGVKIIRKKAFYYCTKLESITIPASVTDICDSAFAFCAKLDVVNIPVSGLRTIGESAFDYCSLTQFDIPLSVLSVGRYAFKTLVLTNVTISKTLYTKLNSDGLSVYFDKAQYTILDVAELNDPITLNNITYTVTNPNFDGTGTVTLTSVAEDLTSVTVPSVVKNEGVTYKVTRIGPDAFRKHTVLTKVVIGSNVLIIDNYAFQGCKNLVSVTGGPRLRTIGTKAFISCPKLKVFSITSTALWKIGTYAFYGDKSLKTLQVKKTTKLVKSGVKKSLKGSSVKTVKVKKSKVKKYKKYFTKKNCGKKVKVKR